MGDDDRIRQQQLEEHVRKVVADAKIRNYPAERAEETRRQGEALQKYVRKEEAKKEQERREKERALEIQEETLSALKKIHALVLTPAQQARQAHSEERNERDDLVYGGRDRSLKAFCCDYAEKTIPPIPPLPEWESWWPGTWSLAYEDKPHRPLISQDRTRIKERIQNSR
jgi:hypothetical protein